MWSAVGFHVARFSTNSPTPEIAVPVCILVDESSMMSPDLVEVLKWYGNNLEYLFFVGDINQLPSIANGADFRDLLHSNVVPTTVLTKVHREGGGPQTQNRKVTPTRDPSRVEMLIPPAHRADARSARAWSRGTNSWHSTSTRAHTLARSSTQGP